MLFTSSTTQQYVSKLSSIDESIAQLLKEKTSVETLMRKSRIADILKQDADWIEHCTAQPRDWVSLLNTKTTSKEWSKNVALEGVSGTSQWAAIEERAITMMLYIEMPERTAVYARLIEYALPFMQPWASTIDSTKGSRFVSIKNNHGSNLLLGLNADNVWTLSRSGGRNAEHFSDVFAALKKAQQLSARSFFDTDY